MNIDQINVLKILRERERGSISAKSHAKFISIRSIIIQYLFYLFSMSAIDLCNSHPSFDNNYWLKSTCGWNGKKNTMGA